VSARLHPAIRLAPAKVNLTLAVVGRRTDGFHALHSVMVPLGLHDRLSVTPAAGAEDTLHVVGADTGPSASNLVLRGIVEARRAVAARHGPAVATPPLAARLEKRIPVAAGLGGGSSDGAAAIEAALEAWATDLPGPVRLATAAALGSDVPFFLAEGPALVQGRGEQLTLLPAPTGAPAGVLLVTPALQIRTADAFAAFDAGGPAGPADPGSTLQSSRHLADELRTGLTAEQLAARAGALAVANDLAPAAFHLAPGLLAFRRAISRMLGRPVGLSGSGPTLWALYPSLEAAREAASAVTGALERRDLEAPGSGRPFVIATDLGGAGGAGGPGGAQ
jgi:4-diphosphocytidyl-2-C-methyl-D-erythritol kinase